MGAFGNIRFSSVFVPLIGQGLSATYEWRVLRPRERQVQRATLEALAHHI